MLKLVIDAEDLLRRSPRWVRAGTGIWRAGASRITLLPHPMLENLVATDGNSVFLAVRERASDSASALDGVRQAAAPVRLSGTHYRTAVERWRSWPHDAVVVEIAGGRLRMDAGSGGCLPVYLAADRGRLVGSWELMDLRPDPNALLGREVARLLSGRRRYCHETLFEGVWMLTERSRATFGVDGLTLHYPPPAARPLPRRLAAGADVIAGWERLMGETLRLRPVESCRSAVQLSGGQDSANVAMSLSAAFPRRVTTCAVMLPGAPGRQQARRRRALLARGRFAADVCVKAMEHPPLHPAGARRASAAARLSPLDEPYAEMMGALTAGLAEGGVHTVFTGFGGDEMMASRAAHRAPLGDPAPSWLGSRALAELASVDRGIAPPTAVPETTLLSLATVGPTLARGGMWPVSPMAAPPVQRFGRWLPDPWRRDKRLLRRRLDRLGLPHEVGHPRLRENFAQVMADALHAYGVGLLRDMAKDSHLVAGGFVDGRRLAAVADRMAVSVRAARAHSRVYRVLAVELALRALD